ncbi:MAG: S9 family peptidase [Duncaniella sp.]|nr:S9 family peptidase [Duncaniella sp.]MDE6466667.1 S9 family peptidase [Duncaniella sp.]
MNLKHIMIASAIAASLASCSGNNQGGNDVIIEKPEFVSQDGQFTIEALEALGRVSDIKVSPDGKKVLFAISYESVEHNKSNADLYTMNIDGSDLKRITRTPSSENGFTWIAGGEKIAFSYPKDGKSQIWVMNADGSGRACVSDVEKGVQGFLFSPDEKKVVIISPIKFSREAKDLYADLPEATGRVIDDLNYKHWDEWITEIPHPFIADFDGAKVSGLYDIMSDELRFESPVKPFGGVESFAWSPDSKNLVYTSRKKEGVNYAISTNTDLYLYNLEDKSTRNLTDGMMGYDTNPAFSPDGKTLAFLSMEHDGYESDKNRIFTLDMASGVKTDLTAEWDYTADAIAWAPDGKSIYFIAPKDGVTPIFNIDETSHEVKVVADGLCDYAALAPVADGSMVTLRHSMVYPNEVFHVAANGEVKQISNVNTELLASLKMPKVEKKMVPTTDGKEMLVWAIYPADFDSTKTYPSLLYCQGGPQQAVSQFWSYRWNLALMAANGYIVIAPNRRGLPGFGTEWNAQISGDYGGQNMKDYLAAVDYMKQYPYIDSARIGATGASYGGFSVYWLAGNHDKRFAALLAHAGIFNMEAQYLETEEMWFANWDMGGGAINAPANSADAPDYGAFWRKDNAIAQRTFANSPHRFVDRWDTPIMISHGEFDYRILSSQGEMAFNAAKLRGIPAEMVIFPDENHWILKPQNAILWQRLFFRWFDRWLKNDSKKTE